MKSPFLGETSQTCQQLLNFSLNQIADFAEFIVGQFLGIRNVPLFAASGPHQGASIAAAHCHGHIYLHVVEAIERFRFFVLKSWPTSRINCTARGWIHPEG